MQKKTAVTLSIGLIAAILLLLYKYKNKIADNIQTQNPMTYLNYNYPNGAIASLDNINRKSCGCNPEASKYMTYAADELAKAKADFDTKMLVFYDQMYTMQ